MAHYKPENHGPLMGTANSPIRDEELFKICAPEIEDTTNLKNAMNCEKCHDGKSARP